MEISDPSPFAVYMTAVVVGVVFTGGLSFILSAMMKPRKISKAWKKDEKKEIEPIQVSSARPSGMRNFQLLEEVGKRTSFLQARAKDDLVEESDLFSFQSLLEESRIRFPADEVRLRDWEHRLYLLVTDPVASTVLLSEIHSWADSKKRTLPAA